MKNRFSMSSLGRDLADIATELANLKTPEERNKFIELLAHSMPRMQQIVDEALELPGGVPVTREDVAKEMEAVVQEISFLREAGQKEYAHDESNAMRNFEASGEDVDVPREKVLWIFMKKHMDGILAHIRGHRSQREPVYGRINDVIVYLILLRSMLKANETQTASE